MTSTVDARPPLADRMAELADLVSAGAVMILSGAGLSTESGIPDYRGPTGSRRTSTPMTLQTFTRDTDARRRYWARSHIGWRTIARARPNAGHIAVARLQARGVLSGIVTQNVDGLHQAGGASDVIDLHGILDRVVCLGCGALTGRGDLDVRLRDLNPGWTTDVGMVNADGDVDLPDESVVARFRTADCIDCGGMLKPDVVFFGEHVPGERVRSCYALLERSRSLLVLGSSLTVMSGRRFVLRAAERGIPVAVINQGPSRGQAYATVDVDAPLGIALTTLVAALGATPRTD